jgi:hypothetical protein
MRRRADRGQATIIVIGVLFISLLFVGLTVDGTRLLLARLDARALADAAALAGSSALDIDGLRSSGGDQVRLAPPDARAAAQAVITRTNGADGVVAADGDRVVVHVSVPVEMMMLRLLGVQRVGATATARPVVR